MDTLLLTEPDTAQGGWDLTLDSGGNIALATGAFAVAQDVASAVKTFIGEVYYDTTIGIPYFQDILGKRQNLGVVQALISRAALTVPTVVQAKTTLTGLRGRAVTGSVRFVDETGRALNVKL